MNRFLKRTKDKLYYFFILRNKNINYEYDYYVNTHLDEHRSARWKHWALLARLNWHYRILRKTDYLLDVPIDESFEPEKNVNLPIEPEEDVGLYYPESKAFVRENIEKVVDKLSKYDIISFDIFDTLIFRPFEAPIDLFGILALEMGRPDFKDIRIFAERTMRSMTEKSNGEINIYDIYQYIENVYGIEAAIWAQREIELELEFCYANPYIKMIYNALVTKGKTIVATSDMYLPGKILSDLLIKCGYTNIDQVFVSCDYECSKANGRLQRIVEDYYGNDKRYIQVGDNYFSDIEGSKSCGWSTYYYENINKRGLPYRPPVYNTLARSVYCGIVNAELHASSMDLNPYYEFGFVYGGLLVCGYCEWLNRLAKNEGVDKFLFISRDGDIINKVYNRFYKEIDNEYIYASRFALFQACFEDYFHLFWENVIDIRQGKSLGAIFAETDLSFLDERLPEYGFLPDDILTVENSERLMGMIYAERENIAKHFRSHRTAAEKYVKSFVGDYKKVCLVDVGWNGTVPLILSNLIKIICPEVSTVTAMLATRDKFISEERILSGTLHCYLHSMFQNRDLIPSDWIRSNTITELLFSAPHPSMLQYKWKGNSPSFIFEDDCENNYAITREIQRGILRFAEIYNSITMNRKDIFQISAYEAHGPLIPHDLNSYYTKSLFDEYKWTLLCGNNKNTPITLGEMFNGKLHN